jgi:hypothetical protein
VARAFPFRCFTQPSFDRHRSSQPKELHSGTLRKAAPVRCRCQSSSFLSPRPCPCVIPPPLAHNTNPPQPRPPYLRLQSECSPPHLSPVTCSPPCLSSAAYSSPRTDRGLRRLARMATTTPMAKLRNQSLDGRNHGPAKTSRPKRYKSLYTCVHRK